MTDQWSEDDDSPEIQHEFNSNHLPVILVVTAFTIPDLKELREIEKFCFYLLMVSSLGSQG